MSVSEQSPSSPLGGGTPLKAGSPAGAQPGVAPARAADLRRIIARPMIDIGGGVSLVLALVLIGGAVMLGGRPGSFLDLAAFLIVGGGTVAVTAISFPISEVLATPRQILSTLTSRPAHPMAIAVEMLRLAEQARQAGALSLEGMLPRLTRNDFLHRSIGMLVDGMPSDQIEAILGNELASHTNRSARGSAIMRRAGEVAPAMGLIGTLVGLIQMLGRLDEPSQIAPGMAVALLTTFYGALFANMFLLPLAAKMERNGEDEAVIKQIYLAGAMSIARQENPRRLELVLNTILPVGQRVKYFD
jgi:chemotaxis protein MotA